MLSLDVCLLVRLLPPSSINVNIFVLINQYLHALFIDIRAMSGSENEDYVFVDEPAFCDRESPELVAELRAWLKPTDYLGESSDFKRHLNSHVPGTGDWLPQTSQYQQWHDGAAGALWLKAIAGAGKSVLAARLVSQLLTTESKAPVLFFFFRQIVALNHDVHPLARDWLAQLLEFSPYLRTKLKAWIKQERDVKDMAFAELWKLLVDSFNVLPKVYCVVDALDELDSQKTNDFLLRLVDLGQTRPDAVKVLMTSRPLPQIQKVLNAPSVLQVRLEDRQTNKDISLFLRHRLREAHHVSEGSKETIRRAVEDHAHPSFLYARLVLNDLLDEHKRNSVDIASAENVLLALPSSMEDKYSQMLHDHAQVAGVPQERQMLILQLATHASRPLRLLEIATVLDFLDMGDGGNKFGDTKNLTRMSCGPLLEILEDETVSIIHHSFAEFLIDRGRKQDVGAFPVIESTKAHELLALLCVRYLLSGPLSSWKITNRSPVFRNGSVSSRQKSLQLQHPFLAYALSNWHYHMRHLKELNEPLVGAVKTFISRGNQAFGSWIDLVVCPGFSVELMSPLHVAAWAGLTSMAKLLHMTGSSQMVNGCDGDDHTPLALAAQRGHTDTVAYLLDIGAVPDQPDKLGLSALHFAAQSNHHAIVRLLLKAGVSPLIKKAWENPGRRCGNARSTAGDTPLKYASESGCVEAVREMIPYLDADSCVSSLRLAVKFRHTALVKLLIEPANIDIKVPLAGDLLLRAGNNRDVDTMQFLIGKGVDPLYRKERDSLALCLVSLHSDEPAEDSSLILAICAGYLDSRSYRWRDPGLPLEPALDFALDAGCEVNDIGLNGKTPLHYCVGSTVSVVERLLERGADVHARDSAGRTPLHLLKPCPETIPILDLLLRHGAKWDDGGSNTGKTLAHICLESWEGDDDLGVLQPFVEDWNAQDAAGNTPLHVLVARHMGPKYIARLIEQLISFGADVNQRSNAGNVPLHVIHPDCISHYAPLLAAAGANLEARDNEGRTWFLLAAMNGSWCPDSLSKVIAFGVDINAVDFDGNNALHVSCTGERAATKVEYFLQAGIDPLHVNHKGDTLYHKVMRRYFEFSLDDPFDVLCLLRATDIPVLSRNHGGETLLHIAFSSSPEDSESCKLLHSTRSPFCLFQKSDIASMISTADHQGRLPIHRAATTGEEYVGWLIDRGAEVSVRTYQKQNPLHLAAIAKQSNVIGLVLEAYGDAERQRKAVNERDVWGRTPLHYACQSARPESVKLLLAAGADPSVLDEERCTALHMCAQFHRKLDISFRYGDIRSNPSIRSDDDTLRVKDIVHLLCRHGADLMSSKWPVINPVQYAINACSAPMAAALLDEIDGATDARKSELERHSDLVPFLRLACANGNASSIVDQVMQDDSTDMIGICDHALVTGAFGVLDGLARRGVQPRRRVKSGSEDFLHTLARWGFLEQFEKFGSRRQEEGWVNGSQGSPDTDYPGVQPFILPVVQSNLPNMDLLSLVVETFKADVNIKRIECLWYSMDTCALHILARGSHWWQTGAIQYLLDHGADANITDALGRNALHVAVQGDYQRLRIVKLLLDHGADPNAADEKGTTPLTLVQGDGAMATVLIEYGADIKAGKMSLLSKCIKMLDIDMLRAMLATGIDCNQRIHNVYTPLDIDEWDYMDTLRLFIGSHDTYPLQKAALRHAGSDTQRAKVAAAVQLLLDNGADPWAPVNGDTTILHDLLSRSAMVETFLAQPNIEIDQRDSRGRTLLLAACHGHEQECSRGLDSVVELTRRLWDMGADISAATNEGDTVVHLLLRSYGLQIHEFEAQVAAKNNKRQNNEAAETLRQLIEKCPSLAVRPNLAGYTPIHIAARRLLLRLVRQLRDAGADIQAPDPKGNTILHHIVPNMCFCGEDALHEYLALGLDINARNHDGLTPVWKHFADGVCAGEKVLTPDMLETLRIAGADLMGRNGDGESLLHLVARMKIRTYDSDRESRPSERSDTGAFKYLLGLGLDPLLEDNKQRTAMVSYPFLYSWSLSLLVGLGLISCRMLLRHMERIVFWNFFRRDDMQYSKMRCIQNRFHTSYHTIVSVPFNSSWPDIAYIEEF